MSFGHRTIWADLEPSARVALVGEATAAGWVPYGAAIDYSDGEAEPVFWTGSKLVYLDGESAPLPVTINQPQPWTDPDATRAGSWLNEIRGFANRTGWPVLFLVIGLGAVVAASRKG